MKTNKRNIKISGKDNPKLNEFMKNNKQTTFIDLFAGIGGTRLAFEAAKAKCAFSSEWDKYSQKTYKANFGETPKGDITKIDAKDIPDFDILVAGFPCQPFSGIGKREGFKHKTQGTLFYDIVRVLDKKKPAILCHSFVKLISSKIFSPSGVKEKILSTTSPFSSISVWFDMLLASINFCILLLKSSKETHRLCRSLQQA